MSLYRLTIYEQEDTLRIAGYSLHMKVHKIAKHRLERLPNREQAMSDTSLGKPKVWKKLGIKIRDLSKSYSTPKK